MGAFLSNPDFWMGLIGLVSMIIGGSKAKVFGGERFKTARRAGRAIRSNLLLVFLVTVVFAVGCPKSGYKIPADECGRACGGPERIALAQVACSGIEDEQRHAACMLAPAVAQEFCRASCAEPE
jgi:hypothetical protein